MAINPEIQIFIHHLYTCSKKSPRSTMNDKTPAPPNHPNLSLSKDVENIWKQKHSAVGSTVKTWSLKSWEHLYRSIKQNHQVVKKLFSYHFNMHLFRANTFFFRPSSWTQTFRYRSIKQNKRFCYRLSKQNKTTLRTMSSNCLQSTGPSTGNVTFSGLEPWVSNFGNLQFLTMIVA